jgi:hypothetical protein
MSVWKEYEIGLEGRLADLHRFFVERSATGCLDAAAR